MTTNEPLARLTCLTLLLLTVQLAAEETAVVKDGRINVRGQPSLVGEVITQLQKGEKVIILEEVAPPKGKTNEPTKWARIQMPQNTPVWVYGPFLDSTDKTVKVTRLNLRAGPGENYSVVGRLEKGAKVNEIRRVEDWVEIETPPGAYAFVATDFLTKLDGTATAAAVTPTPAKVIPPPPVVQEPPKAELPKAEPPKAPIVSNEAPAPVTPAPVPSTTVTPEPIAPPAVAEKPVAEKPTTPSVPVVAAAPAPAVSPSSTVAKPSAEEVTPRRIVRREGLVRSTVSIQAPTYYELLSPENRKTINYLHADKLDLNLKDYRGRRIIVTGEEAIDPRWPKTPVIEVETLELIP